MGSLLGSIQVVLNITFGFNNYLEHFWAGRFATNVHVLSTNLYVSFVSLWDSSHTYATVLLAWDSALSWYVILLIVIPIDGTFVLCHAVHSTEFMHVVIHVSMLGFYVDGNLWSIKHFWVSWNDLGTLLEHFWDTFGSRTGFALGYSTTYRKWSLSSLSQNHVIYVWRSCVGNDLIAKWRM